MKPTFSQDLPAANVTIRGEYLATASKLVCGDRNKEYGDPFENLGDCAELWSAYLRKKYGGKVGYLTAEDVAWMNVLQKMARSFHGPAKADTYIDAAGYAAIAGECAMLDKGAA
jgi:hypothetical protein